MSSQTFRISGETLENYETLDESDIGLWALMVNGAIVMTCEDKSEVLDAQRAAEGLPTELGSMPMTMSYDADDDCDDQGGVYGENLFDNSVGEGEWDQEEIRRNW